MKIITKILQEIKFFFYGNILSYIYTKNKRILKKNKELHNKYEGKRIFIFYSGSSILNVNFNSFKNEYVMGANLLALHNNFKDLEVDFYAYTGSWNYSLSKYMAWGLHEIYDGINPDAKLFLNSSSYFWINNLNYCGIVDDRDKFKANTFFINNKSFILDSGNNVNCDLPKRLHGVISRSIGMAIDLGFKEIYLIGADYSKDPIKVGHFYGSTNFITSRNKYENEIYEGIRHFADDRNISIFNVIDEGFSSPFFKGVNQSELDKILDN